MVRNRILLIGLLAVCLFCSFRPHNKYLRKAARYTEKGNIREAKTWYQKALEKEPESYQANLGMGLLLCELLDNYSGALPYLEKAYKYTGKDTLGDLMYALAKCYHHNGEYEKAISFFDRMNNYEDYDEEIEFQKDIAKRRQDCYYAIKNKNYTPPSDWYIVNAGKNINSDMPEYVPVLTPQNELIFTSRRKDDEREQVSYLDGKYFESMYISSMENGRFKEPRRYTLPDQVKSHFLKNHESVVSMSPDGKKLFTYRDNKVFEINMDERASQKPKKLLKTINFDYYQNHAFLTKDGNTLYFTSEAKGGLGGIDIYRSVKIKEGEWSKPENIGAPVNTEYDEDAPYVTEDGKTLYFASTGHEGFGNFDIYKSELIDGKWSEPVNLGQPINSPANDIFIVMDSKQTVGYFSSSRVGGYGDMDIYKINYLSNFNRDCPGTDFRDITIAINNNDEDTTDFKNKVTVTVPPHYKILSYEWRVNDSVIDNRSLTLDHDYKKRGEHTVFSKVIAYCDTCFSPVIACVSLQNKFVLPKKDTTSSGPDTPVTTVDLTKVKGLLNTDQLKALGFNVNPILFDFDKSEIREDAAEIINTNNEVLKKYPGLIVEIIGYTDSRGSLAYNKALSQRRANKVKKKLKEAGIKNSQIKFSTGKGVNEPAVDCSGKDCDDALHQQNRRVIFKVYSK